MLVVLPVLMVFFSSQEFIETDLEIVLPELEEISNSTLPDFTLYQDA